MPKFDPTKKCAGCDLHKPVTDFWHSSSSKDGYSSRCKVCAYKSHRKWCEKHKKTLIELPDEKKCSHCQIVKQRGEFTLSRNSPDHLDYLCKACKREKGKRDYPRGRPKQDTFDQTLRRFHGIRRTDYERMWADQHGRCAICATEFSKMRGRRFIACVDHDHQTDRVRGLLCQRCNGCLGGVESPGFLARAIEYLRRHGSVIPSVSMESAALAVAQPIAKKAPRIYRGNQRQQMGLFYHG